MKKNLTSIVLILSLIFCITGCGKTDEKDLTSSAVNVKVGKVEINSIEEHSSYTGEIKSKSEASITARVSGTVNSILVDIGDFVEAGDALMTIDSKQYLNAYNQAKAAYDQAVVAKKNANIAVTQAEAGHNTSSLGNAEQTKNNLNQAVSNAESTYNTALDNYNRQLELFEIGAISQVALESAKSNLDSAKIALDTAISNAKISTEVILPQTEISTKASVDQAKIAVEQADATISQTLAALNIAQDNLDACTIVAPISGYITSKNAVIGQMASPGMEIFKIQNSEMLDVEINVTESVISSINTETDAVISINSAGIKDIKGKVTSVGEAKNPQTGMFSVKLSIPNDDKKIKIGMLADINLVINKSSEVLTIDYNALIQEEDKYFVYVAEGDVAIKKEIEIGISDGNKVEVLFGLLEGELVITDGKDFLSETNNKIKIVQ